MEVPSSTAWTKRGTSRFWSSMVSSIAETYYAGEHWTSKWQRIISNTQWTINRVNCLCYLFFVPLPLSLSLYTPTPFTQLHFTHSKATSHLVSSNCTSRHHCKTQILNRKIWISTSLEMALKISEAYSIVKLIGVKQAWRLTEAEISTKSSIHQSIISR
jgi:hypothetical protein